MSSFFTPRHQISNKQLHEELVIGKDRFGIVYKGIIDFGERIVAIKWAKSTSKQRSREFLTEIEMLSKFQHSHIVSLIGYCDDDEEMILVYDYMPSGSLADHLHKRVRKGPANQTCTYALCGRPAVDASLDEEQISLAGWAQHCSQEGLLEQIIDPNIKVNISSDSLNTFVNVAIKCLHTQPKLRPTMAEVVVGLQSALALQEKSTSYSITHNPTPTACILTYKQVLHKYSQLSLA